MCLYVYRLFVLNLLCLDRLFILDMINAYFLTSIKIHFLGLQLAIEVVLNIGNTISSHLDRQSNRIHRLVLHVSKFFDCLIVTRHRVFQLIQQLHFLFLKILDVQFALLDLTVLVIYAQVIHKLV